MKIAVATDDYNTVGYSFRTSKGFLIVTVELNQINNKSFRDNKALDIENCGPEKHAIIIDSIKDCEIAIAKNFGKSIYEATITKGITPIITDKELIDDAIMKIIN